MEYPAEATFESVWLQDRWPILKDKLFFFTDFDFYNSPQGRSFTRQILTPDAANGLFTYATSTPQTGNAWTTCVASSPRNNNGPACTVNLAQLAATNGFAYTPDPLIATVIAMSRPRARPFPRVPNSTLA